MNRATSSRILRDVGMLLLIVFSVFAGYHLFFEDDSAVWVNITPAFAKPDVIPRDSTTLQTYWHGYRRRSCGAVYYWREIRRESDGLVMSKYGVPASSVEATRPEQEPSGWAIDLPQKMEPGKYLFISLEEANCNIFKKWRNEVARIEFEVR